MKPKYGREELKKFLANEILVVDEDLADIQISDEIDETYFLKQQTRLETLQEVLSKI